MYQKKKISFKNKILCGDVFDKLKELPDESINCIITSPPYFNIRSYLADSSADKNKEIGLEKSPDKYIENLVLVFRECKRVLKEDGVFFLNIGDSYAGSGKAGKRDSSYFEKHKIFGKKGKPQETFGNPVKSFSKLGIKAKDLIGIPWALAFALRNDGWYLRQECIWAKSITMKQENNFGSCLPESNRDRFCKSHETIFLLTKSKKYYFDQKSVSVPVSDSSIIRYAQDIDSQTGSNRVPGKSNGNMKAKMKSSLKAMGGDENGNYIGQSIKGHDNFNMIQNSSDVKRRILKSVRDSGELLANRRSIWYVGKSLFKGKHFATMPKELAEIMVKSGCPERGIILDPFFGAGTTGLVAKKFNRDYIGIEINPDFVKMAEERINGIK